MIITSSMFRATVIVSILAPVKIYVHIRQQFFRIRDIVTKVGKNIKSRRIDYLKSMAMLKNQKNPDDNGGEIPRL